MSTDLELLKAIRDLRRKVIAAEKSGLDFTPAMQEEAMRAASNGKYGVADAVPVLQGIDTSINPRNVLRSGVQGATFGFGDELLGLVSPRMKEESRLRQEMYAKEHPIANAAGEIAGGFAVPGLGASKLAGRAATFGGGLLKGAAIGAAGGAAAGAGGAETMADVPGAMVSGGVAGGVLGAAVPGVVGAARLGFSPVARGAAKLAGAVKESGGIKALQKASAEFTKSGRGADVMFGDLSPHLTELMDFVANNNHTAFVKIQKSLRGRKSMQSNRLLADVKQLMGNKHAATELERMKTELSDWGSSPEGFEGLRAQNPQLENVSALGELSTYLKQPKVRDLWAQVREDRLIGDMPDMGNPSFAQLHTLKQKLGRVTDKLWATPGERDTGRALGEVRDRVDMALEQMVPEYRARNAVWRQGLAEQKALTLGTKWVGKADNVELMRTIAKLDPKSLEAFRTGFTSQLLIKLRSAKTNRNIAGDLMSDAALQERIEVVYGDKNLFHQFMERVTQEAQMAESSTAVAGSQTHRRKQAAAFDPTELIPAVASGGSYGLPAAAAVIGRKMPNVIARRTAGTLTDTFLTKGSPAIDALLQKLSGRPPTSIPPWMQTTAPAALGSTVPGLLQPPQQ